MPAAAAAIDGRTFNNLFILSPLAVAHMTLPAPSSPPLAGRRAFLAALATLPLGGCLSLGGGLVARAGGAASDAGLTLNVVTTRRIAGGGDASPFFGPGRAAATMFARAQIATPDASGIGRITALVASDYAVAGIRPHEGEAGPAFAEALRGRDTLLFVHGYNQTFENAAVDAVALARGIGFSGNMALFSWASKGGLLDYGYDRESAMIARDALADAMASVLGDPFGARLHLVAHSMGTLALLEALRVWRDRYRDVGIDRIGAVVLASPDIDIDVFKANIGRLGPVRDKMTVITATSDRALDVSRRLAGGDRVGALPRAALADLGIRVVDATDFASGLVRHDAFLSSADVRAVVRRAVERA